MAEVAKKITFKHAFAGAMVLFFGVIIFSLTFTEIPPGNREVYVHLLGILEGVVVTIGGYYFGSSSGSKEKTNMLESELNKKT